MAEIHWIKISTSMFDDEKIKLIETLPDGDTLVVLLLKMLLLAGKKNCRGEIFINEELAYTPDMLATLFGRKLSQVQLALSTFSRFRIIELQQDGTIIFLNWHKHQAMEGLEKIRLANADRQRKHRDKLALEKAARLQLTQGDSHATRNVTGRDTVTPDPVTVTGQRERESKSRREEPLPSPKGDADGGLSFSAAKLWINTAFKRKRAWSYEEDQLLSELVPIIAEEKRLIDWAYSLEPDHEFFKFTRLNQEVTTFLRNYRGLVDRIKTARGKIGFGGESAAGAEDEGPAWPPGSLDAAFDLWGESRKMPARFSDLPASARTELRAYMEKEK